jgi:hypothetical protein
MQEVTKKRKLPSWIVEGGSTSSNEGANDEGDNAQLALEILERGLKESFVKRQNDWLLPDDYDSGVEEDDEAFSLSQSSVVDVMTCEDALALVENKSRHDLLKYDRKGLIEELKRACCAQPKAASS